MHCYGLHLPGSEQYRRYLEAAGDADMPNDAAGEVPGLMLAAGDIPGETSGDIAGDTMGVVDALGDADPAGGPHAVSARTATIIRTIIARTKTFFIS